MNFSRLASQYYSVDQTVAKQLYEKQKRALSANINIFSKEVAEIRKVILADTKKNVISKNTALALMKKEIDTSISNDTSKTSGIDFEDIRKSMNLLKGRIATGNRGLTNRINALEKISEMYSIIYGVDSDFLSSEKNYGDKIKQASLVLRKARDSGGVDKQNISSTIKEISSTFSQLNKEIAEYVMLYHLENKINEAITQTTFKGSRRITAEKKQTSKTAPSIEVMDSKVINIKYINEDNSAVELNIAMRDYSTSALKFFGKHLKEYNFGSVLPVLQGNNSSMSLNIAKDTILNTFTYGIHGLRYYMKEDDLMFIRKIIASILLSLSIKDSHMVNKGIYLSLMGNKYGDILNNSSFFPAYDELELSGFNENSMGVHVVAPSTHAEVSTSSQYLDRYVNTKLKLKQGGISYGE